MLSNPANFPDGKTLTVTYPTPDGPVTQSFPSGEIIAGP